MIVADPSQDSVDKYGRALGYIEVGGKDLGLALVRAGRADVYIYGGVPFARVAKYQAAQKRAKAEVLGVFATCKGDFHSEQQMTRLWLMALPALAITGSSWVATAHA